MTSTTPTAQLLRRRLYALGAVLLGLLVLLRWGHHPAPFAFVEDFARRHALQGGVIAYGAGSGQPPSILVFGTAGDAPGRLITPTDRFKIASLTKPVTAEAILRLSDLGLITLDTPLADIFPHVRAAKDPRMAQVTVRHLLLHRAGWDAGQTFDPLFMTQDAFRTATGWAGPVDPTCNALADGMLALPLQFDPGTTFAYSNLGYCWLGRIIEHTLRKPYAEAIATLVPGLRGVSLDLDHATTLSAAQRRLPQPVFVDTPAVIGAAGGLISDAASYFAFAAAEKDPRLFERPAGEEGPVFYGLGWRVRNLPEGTFVTHMGSMPGAFSLVIRDLDGATVVGLFYGQAARPYDAFDEFLASLLADGFPHGWDNDPPP